MIKIIVVILLWIIKICLLCRVLKALTDYFIHATSAVSHEYNRLKYGKHIILITFYSAIIMLYYTIISVI